MESCTPEEDASLLRKHHKLLGLKGFVTNEKMADKEACCTLSKLQGILRKQCN